MGNGETDGSLRSDGIEVPECKEAGQALRESEQRLRLAMAAGRLGFWDVDLDSQRVTTNEELWRNLGYEATDLTPDFACWAGLIHPDDSAGAIAAFRDHVAGKTARYRAEIRMRTKAGDWKWTLSQGLATDHDAVEKARRVVGVNIDIDERKRAEESLLQSQQRLELAAEAADIHLWEFDIATQTATYDERWPMSLGYTPEEIQPTFSAGWGKLIHPDDLPAMEAALQAHIENRTAAFQFEYRVRTKNGRWKWISSRSKIVSRSPDGKPLRIAGTNLDVTERKEADEALRESEERFRAAFEQAAVGIGHLSPSGHWMRINEKFAQMLGYRRDEMIGRQWSEFTHPEDMEMCAQLIGTLVRNGQGAFQTEKRWLRKDGTPLWAEMTVSSIRDRDGAIRYFSALCVDITERKDAEVERQAREAAESANRAKSEFLANVSHELRSPLNTILGFAKLVLRSGLPEEAKRDVGIIVRSGEHLLNLINQVLAMSQIEAGRVALDQSAFDLRKLLRELQEMFARRAEERGLEFVVEGGPEARFIRADQMKLRQVLINLLSNAVKFTRAGSIRLTAEVRAEAAAPGAAPLCRLRLAVSDTGPGIAADELKQLFGPFVQAEAGRQAGEGSGLGLAISRSFVRLMGGELEIESRPGSGTTVWFEVPVEDAGDEAAVPARSTRRAVALAPGEACRRILVVDDMAEAREVLIRLLQPLGFDIREAADGFEAVRLAHQWLPDLIWMDLAMPGLDGLAAARRIKAEAPRRPIIIALTAHVFEKEWPDVEAAGCDDFLHKPFQEDKLLSLLEKHLGVRFIYEEATTEIAAATPANLALAALAGLPDETRDELATAVIRLDTSAVDHWIQTMRTFDPRLAEGVAELADGFQYDRILSYIQAAPPVVLPSPGSAEPR
jgi:PAS domain S-box-containing protein